MLNKIHNPDILTCLANLSNDEVFTPPNIAKQMLDTLPQELFTRKDTKFLDPFTKSGVLLREIAIRLIKGLEKEIPDLQERVNHIMQHQIYGIGITELTALLARRTLYCAKNTTSEHSVTPVFENQNGNIAFDAIQHTWIKDGVKMKCKYCGTSSEILGEDKREHLETHAYQFIHNKNPFKNMKFDVIIGNPPYQLSDGGGRGDSARPIYHLFVEQAIKMRPHYLCMITPARWYSGGKGLDTFREKILSSNKLMEIHDFPETSDCFQGINIRGGVCYFLWNKEHNGNCSVFNYKEGKAYSVETRPLLEKNAKLFIRYNKAVGILRKVQTFNEDAFDQRVSARRPFGLDSNFSNFKKQKTGKYDIKLIRFGDDGYVSDEQIVKNNHWVKEIKVLVSKASPGGDNYPHQIISQPIIAGENTCCTETYLIVSICGNMKTAKNLQGYMKTYFFRFMMSLIKNTQNIARGVFAYVPIQNFDEEWTDEKLYAKYGLTEDEIAYIESMIRPMD